MDLRSEFDSVEVPEEWWLKRMRIHRNALLVASDWTQTVDDSTSNRQAWADYRQALRDFPATWTPGPVAEFPEPPEVV
jgi:hypothetical protein